LIRISLPVAAMADFQIAEIEIRTMVRRPRRPAGNVRDRCRRRITLLKTVMWTTPRAPKGIAHRKSDTQAIDATTGHAQAPCRLKRTSHIVAFETAFYGVSSFDFSRGN